MFAGMRSWLSLPQAIPAQLLKFLFAGEYHYIAAEIVKKPHRQEASDESEDEKNHVFHFLSLPHSFKVLPP